MTLPVVDNVFEPNPANNVVTFELPYGVTVPEPVKTVCCPDSLVIIIEVELALIVALPR